MNVAKQKREEAPPRAPDQFGRGQLDAIREIVGSISTEKNPDNLLEHVLCAIGRQMGGQSICVYSRNEDDSLTREVVYEYSKMHSPEKKERYHLEDQPLYRECMESGTECLLTEYDRDPIWLRFVNRPNHAGVPLCNRNTLPLIVAVHSRLCAQGVIMNLGIPMALKGRVSGFLTIRYNKRREFLPEEIKLSMALAHQAALAIQLMRLSHESRQTAVTAERTRIARDIHDTLAQGFTGVIAQLQAAKGSKDLVNIAAHIELAEELARSSLGEARRSVMALRPRSLCEAGLSTAMESTLRTVGRYAGLNTHFTIEGEQRPVSPEWEEALLRITQESLTNTIKHAGAHNFQAKISFGPRTLQLKLTDDGYGFDPQMERDGFGLIGIRERVHQMGGSFMINSQSGRGTEIIVTVLCALNAEPSSV